MIESTVAHAVANAVTQKKINVVPLLKSLERDYKVEINASHTGIEVWKDGQRIYKHGMYSRSGASTPEQRYTYRRRLLKLFKWALDYKPTPEIKAAQPWLEDQDEWN